MSTILHSSSAFISRQYYDQRNNNTINTKFEDYHKNSAALPKVQFPSKINFFGSHNPALLLSRKCFESKRAKTQANIRWWLSKCFYFPRSSHRWKMGTSGQCDSEPDWKRIQIAGAPLNPLQPLLAKPCWSYRNSFPFE